jgi:hypothetical protein
MSLHSLELAYFKGKLLKRQCRINTVMDNLTFQPKCNRAVVDKRHLHISTENPASHWLVVMLSSLSQIGE